MLRRILQLWQMHGLEQWIAPARVWQSSRWTCTGPNEEDTDVVIMMLSATVCRGATATAATSAGMSVSPRKRLRAAEVTHKQATPINSKDHGA